MTYLKSKTAFWPELILMVLVQLRLAEARALAEAAVQPPPPRPKGSAPAVNAEQESHQARIAPSRRRTPAVALAPQPRRRQDSLEADLQSRPPATQQPETRPRRAPRLPLAASSSETRLPGTAPLPGTRALQAPSNLALMPEPGPQAGPQRLMAPPLPRRPSSWSEAGGADAPADAETGAPQAAEPATESESSASPANTDPSNPAPAEATAAGEARLAAGGPIATAPASQPLDPSLAGPIVIIPVRMLPPSGAAAGGLEAAAGAQVNGSVLNGLQLNGLQRVGRNAAAPGAAEAVNRLLPAGVVALSQALRERLPATTGPDSDATGAAGQLAPAGRAIVIRLSEASAKITAAVHTARLAGDSDNPNLPDETNARGTGLASSHDLARLCREGSSALLACSGAAGSIPVDGGRLFWIGTAGQDAGGEGQGGGEPGGTGSPSDTIVLWFKPDGDSAPGPGDASDWISDLTALGNEIDRITSTTPGEPDGPAGGSRTAGDPLIAAMVDGLSACAASGGGLFLAVHDATADVAGRDALFVQIDCLADLGVCPAGDPFA